MTRPLISALELKQLLSTDKLVVIDTRDADSYATGHIPGAVNIHDIFTYLATSTAEGIAELRDKFAGSFGAAGLDGEKTAVIYESAMDTGFGQSCRGYFLLEYLGYPKISVLHGGYGAWLAAELPVSNDVPSPEAAQFPLSEHKESIMADTEAVKAALGDGQTVLLDVRDVDEWVGESSSPYGKDFCPRMGRLPNAVWIEWYRMMKPTASGAMMKSKTELLAECASVGITPASKVIIYCFKGARASNTYLALKEAGVDDVSIYFGSWNEWSRDPSLPIEEGPPFAIAA